MRLFLKKSITFLSQKLFHAITKLEKYNELLKLENICIDVSTFLYKIVLNSNNS